MRDAVRRKATLLVLLLGVGVAQAARATEVAVQVGRLGSASGTVQVQICQRAEWLNDCALVATVPARQGTTTATIPNVPPGTYAVVAFHDANNNGKVDQNFLGIPTEGVGFSRVTSIPLGRPSFDKSALRVEGARVVIPVELFFEP